MTAVQRRFARACVAGLVLAALAGCGERIGDTRAQAPKPLEPSPSAVVIGQAPAEPTGDPAGTTPVASGTTDIGKSTETAAKPQEGDNHSHSTLSSKTPQKADGTDPQQTPDRMKP